MAFKMKENSRTLLVLFIFFGLVICSTAEKDFEFTDDEDFSRDEGSGSGNESITVPEVGISDLFRATVNFSELQYTSEMALAGREFMNILIIREIQAAINKLLLALPGQIQIRIVELRQGSLVVTFDIQTDGTVTNAQVRQLIEEALANGQIGQFRVSPAGFTFRPIRDEYKCSPFVGRKPELFPGAGENGANLMINNLFPCDGFVRGWTYYRIKPSGVAYAGIFRQVSETEFMLVDKTELPAGGVGVQNITVVIPILARTGDFIGVFYPNTTRENVVSKVTQQDNVLLKAELYQTYYVNMYDADLKKEVPFSVNNFVYSVSDAVFGIQAVMDYANVPVVTAAPPAVCTADQYKCANGDCVDGRYRCDGQQDCYDGSDEENCPTVVCLSDEFRCVNQRECVSIAFRCNGILDCEDGSDEAECEPSVRCGPGQFRCFDGTCIDERLRCDSRADCSDGFDEFNCQSIPCEPGQFRCERGQCIMGNQRCNGQIDCPDGTDELDCPSRILPVTILSFRDGSESTSFSLLWRASQPTGIQIIGFRVQYSEVSIRPDRTPDGNYQVDKTIGPYRVVELPSGADRFTIVGLQPGRYYEAVVFATESSKQTSQKSFIFKTADAPVCSVSEFQCKSGTCIDLARKCDGFPDCPDDSDEVVDCFNKTKLCSEGQVVCKDRLGNINCVTPQEWNPSICISECRQDEFQCQNGQCVSAGQRCDRQSQCTDGSDEINCTCPVNTFQCRQTNILECIDNKLHCDGTPDCTDGSDEEGCTCAKDFFRCNDGNCVPDRLRCDGIPQCEDGSDEIQCACPASDFQCANLQCIDLPMRCDGFPDCVDRSDEIGCPTCRGDQFQCADENCVEARMKCDGTPQCEDGSDERNCPSCPPNNFQCETTGPLECVDVSLVCDGFADCTDKSDEVGCPSCRIDQFTCTDGTCVEGNMRCDGIAQCEDGSDEIGCPFRCAIGEFKCAGTNDCVAESFRCDGTSDCPDRSDEFNCTCRENQFQCGDGICIDERRRCDGTVNCDDKSDELACPCRSGEFQCRNGDCIPEGFKCNSRAECEDGSDEENCACKETEFRCNSGECIDFRRRCDRVRDCRDGSDETNCPSIVRCPEGYYQCGTGHCLSLGRRCDGQSDCPDGSDEIECSTEPPKSVEIEPNQLEISEGEKVMLVCSYSGFPPGMRFDWRRVGQSLPVGTTIDRRGNTLIIPEAKAEDSGDYVCTVDNYQASTRVIVTRRIACAAGEFQCRSDRTCIDARRFCNGFKECADGSDEMGCPTLPPKSVDISPRNLDIREGAQAILVCNYQGFPPGTPFVWSRVGNELPMQSSVDRRGSTLTIPVAKVVDSGDYVCSVDGYQALSRLNVVRIGPEPEQPAGPCGREEAVCRSGQCIRREYRCDGEKDCLDGSDEMDCFNGTICEPNEFQCPSGQCMMKIWRCDGEQDCKDGFDEQNCRKRGPNDPCEPDEFQCVSGDQCIPLAYQCDKEIDCQDRSDEIGCSAPVIVVPPVAEIEVELGETFTIICEAVGVPTPLIVWRLNWGNIRYEDRITTVSEQGRGTLTVRDARYEDAGAYTCEAINNRGSIFAIPDAIVIVRLERKHATEKIEVENILIGGQVSIMALEANNQIIRIGGYSNISLDQIQKLVQIGAKGLCSENLAVQFLGGVFQVACGSKHMVEIEYLGSSAVDIQVTKQILATGQDDFDNFAYQDEVLVFMDSFPENLKNEKLQTILLSRVTSGRREEEKKVLELFGIGGQRGDLRRMTKQVISIVLGRKCDQNLNLYEEGKHIVILCGQEQNSTTENLEKRIVDFSSPLQSTSEGLERHMIVGDSPLKPAGESLEIKIISVNSSLKTANENLERHIVAGNARLQAANEKLERHIIAVSSGSQPVNESLERHVLASNSLLKPAGQSLDKSMVAGTSSLQNAVSSEKIIRIGGHSPVLIDETFQRIELGSGGICKKNLQVFLSEETIHSSCRSPPWKSIIEYIGSSATDIEVTKEVVTLSSPIQDASFQEQDLIFVHLGGLPEEVRRRLQEQKIIDVRPGTINERRRILELGGTTDNEKRTHVQIVHIGLARKCEGRLDLLEEDRQRVLHCSNRELKIVGTGGSGSTIGELHKEIFVDGKKIENHIVDITVGESQEPVLEESLKQHIIKGNNETNFSHFEKIIKVAGFTTHHINESSQVLKFGIGATCNEDLYAESRGNVFNIACHPARRQIDIEYVGSNSTDIDVTSHIVMIDADESYEKQGDMVIVYLGGLPQSQKENRVKVEIAHGVSSEHMNQNRRVFELGRRGDVSPIKTQQIVEIGIGSKCAGVLELVNSERKALVQCRLENRFPTTAYTNSITEKPNLLQEVIYEIGTHPQNEKLSEIAEKEDKNIELMTNRQIVIDAKHEQRPSNVESLFRISGFSQAIVNQSSQIVEVGSGHICHQNLQVVYDSGRIIYICDIPRQQIVVEYTGNSASDIELTQRIASIGRQDTVLEKQDVLQIFAGHLSEKSKTETLYREILSGVHFGDRTSKRILELGGVGKRTIQFNERQIVEIGLGRQCQGAIQLVEEGTSKLIQCVSAEKNVIIGGQLSKHSPSSRIIFDGQSLESKKESKEVYEIGAFDGQSSTNAAKSEIIFEGRSESENEHNVFEIAGRPKLKSDNVERLVRIGGSLQIVANKSLQLVEVRSGAVCQENLKVVYEGGWIICECDTPRQQIVVEYIGDSATDVELTKRTVKIGDSPSTLMRQDIVQIFIGGPLAAAKTENICTDIVFGVHKGEMAKRKVLLFGGAGPRRMHQSEIQIIEIGLGRQCDGEIELLEESDKTVVQCNKLEKNVIIRGQTNTHLSVSEIIIEGKLPEPSNQHQETVRVAGKSSLRSDIIEQIFMIGGHTEISVNESMQFVEVGSGVVCQQNIQVAYEGGQISCECDIPRQKFVMDYIGDIATEVELIKRIVKIGGSATTLSKQDVVQIFLGGLPVVETSENIFRTILVSAYKGEKAVKKVIELSGDGQRRIQHDERQIVEIGLSRPCYGEIEVVAEDGVQIVQCVHAEGNIVISGPASKHNAKLDITFAGKPSEPNKHKEMFEITGKSGSRSDVENILKIKGFTLIMVNQSRQIVEIGSSDACQQNLQIEYENGKLCFLCNVPHRRVEIEYIGNSDTYIELTQKTLKIEGKAFTEKQDVVYVFIGNLPASSKTEIFFREVLLGIKKGGMTTKRFLEYGGDKARKIQQNERQIVEIGLGRQCQGHIELVEEEDGVIVVQCIKTQSNILLGGQLGTNLTSKLLLEGKSAPEDIKLKESLQAFGHSPAVVEEKGQIIVGQSAHNPKNIREEIYFEIGSPADVKISNAKDVVEIGFTERCKGNFKIIAVGNSIDVKCLSNQEAVVVVYKGSVGSQVEVRRVGLIEGGPILAEHNKDSVHIYLGGLKQLEVKKSRIEIIGIVGPGTEAKKEIYFEFGQSSDFANISREVVELGFDRFCEGQLRSTEEAGKIIITCVIEKDVVKIGLVAQKMDNINTIGHYGPLVDYISLGGIMNTIHQNKTDANSSWGVVTKLISLSGAQKAIINQQNQTIEVQFPNRCAGLYKAHYVNGSIGFSCQGDNREVVVYNLGSTMTDIEIKKQSFATNLHKDVIFINLGGQKQRLDDDVEVIHGVRYGELDFTEKIFEVNGPDEKEREGGRGQAVEIAFGQTCSGVLELVTENGQLVVHCNIYGTYTEKTGSRKPVLVDWMETATMTTAVGLGGKKEKEVGISLPLGNSSLDGKMESQINRLNASHVEVGNGINNGPGTSENEINRSDIEISTARRGDIDLDEYLQADTPFVSASEFSIFKTPNVKDNTFSIVRAPYSSDNNFQIFRTPPDSDKYGVEVAIGYNSIYSGLHSSRQVNHDTGGFVYSSLQGIKGPCSEPFFNTGATSANQCLRCFCFGHTVKCFSSDLSISRISLVSPMQLVDRNSADRVEQAYIEFLPSTREYQVQDVFKVLPVADYYWSLPREFLGERLTSYGGELKYTIYFEVDGRPSFIQGQPDVILMGNGITLYYRGRTVPSPGIATSISVPLTPDAWQKYEGPRRGDTPIAQYASREDLMMVLENLESVFIRGIYDNKQTITRIGGVLMTTAVDYPTELGLAYLVEECTCPTGYTGLSCQDCAPGFNRVQRGEYLGECVSCSCNGHSNDCEAQTGRCRNCLHNTEGDRCERCMEGFYGDPRRGTSNDCQPCPCPLTSSSNQFSRTCVLDVDNNVTCTNCPEGYTGRRCERCIDGYVGNPLVLGSSCRRVPVEEYCDPRGSLSTRPDPVTRQCTCKANINGPLCDSCKPNSFYLSDQYPDGCINCFCMGVSRTCQSTTWNRATVSASFTRDDQLITLTDMMGKAVEGQRFTIDRQNLELVFSDFPSLPRDTYFWSLPARFLGDKVTAYGGSLRFELRFRPRNNRSAVDRNEPLVKISGNDITLVHRTRTTIRPNQRTAFNVVFFEQNWYRIDGEVATREHLMMALADLDSILIRASFDREQQEGGLRDVGLDIAEDRLTGQDRAYPVEQCVCPVGYRGLSCEDCDTGYTRSGAGLYLGLCAPCVCNGHSSECDPETGVCRNCQHNTEGDNCEKCSAGYYGDAKRGTRNDCQKCPCPLTEPPNQFSPTCILASDGQTTCTACPAGHTGRRCESCLPGYTGNPVRRGDYCKVDQDSTCDCDKRGTVPNTQCDANTQQCQCKAYAQGRRCERCKEGYFYLSEENEQGCLSCYCSGITNQCTSSSYYRDVIRPQFGSDGSHNFVLMNRRMNNIISEGFIVDAPRNQITFNKFQGIQNERESLLFQLPAKFRGDKATSYGGYLRFTIEYRADQSQGSLFRDVDVELMSRDQQHRLYFLLNPSLQMNEVQSYEILLREESFRDLSTNAAPTRETFMAVLSDLAAILIRATYHTRMASVTLRDVSMDIAVASPTTLGTTAMVESCRCPQGYTGLSCEKCAPGYLRVSDSGSSLGRCVRCNCNGHAASCDTETGKCLNCQHNTEGDRCERCVAGFYGDATAGTPNDCRPCPCPLTVPSNQFSRTCFLAEDGIVTCDRCPTGYTGRDCGTCASGYVGNPRELGGACRPQEEDQRPVVNVSPVRVEEPVGSTVIFRCSITGQGPFNVVWSRLDSRPLPSDRASQSPRYELTLRELKREDNGRYVCTATNAYGVTRGYVDLTVVSGGPNPIQVQVDRTRIEVEEGQTARIVCTAVGSLREATYILSWSKQGAAMPSRAIDQNGVLIIPNIQVSDAGNFVCTGSDMFSTGSVTATIIVTTSQSAPSIRIEPRYQTVEEGSPVRFECIVTATPRAKVEWHRGDRPLSPEASVTQDGVFQLPRAHSSDEGDYFCKATNNVGTSDMRTILYVTEKQTKPDITIIVRQTSVVALIGSTARLECYVEDETGRVTLFWSRTGGLPPGSVQTDGILTITDIQPSYAGNYVCTGTTDTGRIGSAVTRLDVEVKPTTERPTVRVEPEKITVPMGTTGTLRCIVTGVPAPTITWLKSRQELSTNHQIDGDILRITQATMEDRGIYVCRAENIAGSDQDWGIVEVERRMRPKIDLYPEVTQTVSVGGSALFQCRVMDGDPPPKVTWSRVGGLQLTERTQVMDNGVIMFKGTTQQEQGSYICTATNDIGTTTATATLIVQGPPTIVIQPSKTIYAIVGQRVRMECIAQGEPTPTVYWINPLVPRRGDIVPSASFPQEEGTAILDITNVAKENTGYYTCVAQNVGGRTEDRVQLIVEEGQRAEVKIAGPGTLSVVDGGSVELTCTASAILNPQIRWRRREGPLPPGHSLRGGILSIPQLTVEYGGEYICSTSSPEGSYQASVFIIVTVSPRLTVSPSRLVARAGENIILRCSPTGSGPFNIEWSKVNGVLSPRASENEGVLEIQQVTAADAGRYRCVATSASGSSEGYAVVEITVPPTVRAVEREYSVQQNAVVELRCDFTGSPEPSVRWDHESGELPLQHRVQDGVLTIYNVQPKDSGRYICTATNAAGTARDYVFVTVSSGPVINGGETRIDTQIVNVGDRVEMECIVAGTPLPTIRWSRDDGPLPASAIRGDGILIIPDARLEDAGTYTCTAINQAGSVQSKVVLYVRARPLISVPQSSMTAALGDSASIGCEASGYPSPQITWYRKNGQMPSEYTIVDGNLKIPRVKTEDAGTYICSAQNQHGQSDASVDLKIGDLIPHFKQNPNSYIAYQPLSDVYLDFDLLLSLKPESTEGMVLYNGQNSNGAGDFVCFGLNEGYPEFRFDVGSGPAIIRGNNKLNMTQWHTVKLTRDRQKGTMVVNDEPAYTGVSPGNFQGLDLVQNMYLGSVPDFNIVPRAAGFRTGFVGSVSEVKIKGISLNLGAEALEVVGIEQYDVCHYNPCLNGGICVPRNSKYGYECQCRQGFAGTRCETTGESCYPGACGPSGRCFTLSGTRGFRCVCPVGKTGAGCQVDVNIINPLFNRTSFISYPVVEDALFSLSIYIEFKPHSLEDAILLYDANSRDGTGDFMSLVIKDRYLEFRFDTGYGPAIIKSRKPVSINEWTRVSAFRRNREGSLKVNDEEPVVESLWNLNNNNLRNDYLDYYRYKSKRFRRGISPGDTVGLNLKLPLYLGGVDQVIRVSSNAGTSQGFIGCVAQLRVNDKTIGLVRDALESANVQDCGESRICERQPCANGSTCEDLPGPDYRCVCPPTLTGVNCNIEINICLTQTPCKNQAPCSITPDGYRCDCPLGFMGKNCEAAVRLGTSIEVEGNGFVEFSKDLLPHTNTQERETISFDIKTTEPNGVIVWQAELSGKQLQGADYFSVGLKDGYLELSYELGSGPALLKSAVRVDDGYLHSIQVSRLGRSGTLIVDSNAPVKGDSLGFLQMLNTKGNIFIGGVALVKEMTGNKFTQNFNGCIENIRIQDKGPMRLPDDAISGYNVRPCVNK